MVEEFDAIQRLNLPQVLAYISGLLALGVLAEGIIRFGRRWAMTRNYTWLSAILHALAWLALFWTILLGVFPALLEVIAATIGWEPKPGLGEMMMWISITIFIVRLINGLLRILTATTPSASVTLLNNVLTGMGALVIAVIVTGYVFDLSPLILLLALVGGITGLTVIFQEPLNNLVSGVSLTISERLAPGDWVRLPSGLEGYVRDIQWDVTMVQQFANNLIIVPNSVMTAAELINFDRPESELALLVPVGVHYNSDLNHVEQVVLDEAMKVMTEINGEPPTTPPVIRYNEFADSSINFNVVMRAGDYMKQFALRHEFIKRLHHRFNEEGIVIPFPIRTLDLPPHLSQIPKPGGPQVPAGEVGEGQ
jgi:small-conductance mechanosensitive channel